MPGQPLIFPVKGVHKVVGFDFQPPGTAPDAMNVRGFDTLRARLRGGRRPGLSKYLDSQINGSNPLQLMARVGTAVEAAATVTTVTDNFSSASYGTTGIGNIGGDYARFQVTTTSWNSTIDNSFDGANDWVTFSRIGASVRYGMLAISYKTSNDITGVLRANRQATTNNGNDGLADEPTWAGPFIRGNATCTTGIGARLIRVGANQVQLQLFSFSLASPTQLAVSATQNLDGSATVTADVSIRLFVTESTNTVTAILNWPSAGISNLSISAVTSTNAGETRGGFASYQQAFGAVASWRTLKSITYTKHVPAASIALLSLTGTENNPTNSDRYFLPTSWTSVVLNTGTGVATAVNGFASSAGDPAYAAIDTTNDVVWDVASPVANTVTSLGPTAGSDYDEVEILPKPLTVGTDTQHVSAGFCATSDRRGGIFYTGTAVNGTNATDSGTGGIGSLDLKIVVAGGVVASRNLFSTTAFRMGRLDDYWKMTFDKSTKVFSLYHKGVLLFTDTLSAAEQTAAATLLAASTTNAVFVTSYAGFGATNVGWQVARFVDAAVTTYPVDIKLVAVAGGTATGLSSTGLVPITDGSSALSTDAFAVQATEAFGKLFFVDGISTKYYDKATNTMSTWTASSGTLPTKPRIICLYRGRVVLSGVVTDPHNYFMSAVGDPFNYNYSPATPSQTQAVAGNNSKAGLVGDIINCLIPFGDDVLLFGGDHTIYQMTGDPAAGGTVDLVSDQTGIAPGKSWAKDPDNTLYFWGQNGVYRFRVGGVPENITRGVLNNRFENLNRANNVIRLEWDYFRHGLLVHIVNTNTSIQSTCFLYDARTDAWWPEEYPAAYGPNCMLAFDGSESNDQVFLLGCRDGYIRRFNDLAKDDDGLAIESFVRFAPFIAPNHDAEVALSSILPIIQQNTADGTVRVDIYTGQSAEECFIATKPRVRRYLSHSGRTSNITQKVRGYAVQVAISQVAGYPWAFEGLTVVFNPSGIPQKEVRANVS